MWFMFEWQVHVKLHPAKLIYLNFHKLEVVSRFRDPQLQVGEHYSYLFNLIPNICKSCLTFTALIIFLISHGDQRVFPIWNHRKCLSQLFPVHLNTYVMGLGPLWIFHTYSAGIDFGRQNLTSTDVRFWRLKTVPALQWLHTDFIYNNWFNRLILKRLKTTIA